MTENLAELVADGRFREGLFYRINVIELRLRPLLERPEDIEGLVDAILTRMCHRMKIDVPAISAQALQALRAYAFPGNVRELENIIERAAIIKALEQTRYNKTAAAKLLGMAFRALRHRVKKLGIE